MTKKEIDTIKSFLKLYESQRIEMGNKAEKSHTTKDKWYYKGKETVYNEIVNDLTLILRDSDM